MSAVNDLDTPTAERECKAFATLAARYAMRGYGLIKGDPAIEGQPAYFAMRWGSMLRPMADLEEVEAFLAELMPGAGTGKAGRRGVRR